MTEKKEQFSNKLEIRHMLTSKFKRAQVTPNYLTLLIKTCNRMYGFLGSNMIFWEITTEPDRPRIQRYARQLILAPDVNVVSIALRLRRSCFGTPSMKENYTELWDRYDGLTLPFRWRQQNYLILR